VADYLCILATLFHQKINQIDEKVAAAARGASEALSLNRGSNFDSKMSKKKPTPLLLYF